MREIETFVAYIFFVITGERKSHYTIKAFEQTTSQGNDFYKQLNKLVEQGHICEAENIIFEFIDKKYRNVLEAAVLFYSDINQLTNEELENCNFSREEIMEGLCNVCDAYGIQYDVFEL